MSGDLPAGWAETTLGEICSKPQYGWTCRAAKQGKVKYVRTTDISSGHIDWDGVPFCEEVPDDIEKYRVCSNDILVSRAGSVGVSFRISEVPCDAVFASYLIRFKPLHDIPPKFAELFLNSDSYWRSISEFAAGIAVPNVNASKLASLEMPLPPIAEQKRIVAKVEKLLAKVDASRARLDKVSAILKRFRQSVLVAACSGRLTADWRMSNPDSEPFAVAIPTDLEVDDEFPENWTVTRLGTMVKLVTSGSRGWAKYYATSGAVFIRAQNINADYLNLDDIAFVRPPVKTEGARTKVQQGDLLITITGANITKSALVEKPMEQAYVSQHVALVRLKNLHIARFLFYALVSPLHGRRQLYAAAYGQGKPSLNLDNIRNVVIGLPPLSEQQEIVRRVEELFALADGIEARVGKARGQVDKLTQSILAKAFRGELVPQDPNDEPAEKLLARIRAH